MSIRDLISALEAFAKKHGDDSPVVVDAMYGCSPPTALYHNGEVLLVEMAP